MSLSKEEIALQLALSQMANLQPSVGCCASPDALNSAFNKSLGEEVASLYNAIYNNLDCYKPSKNEHHFSSDNSSVVI